MNPVSLYLTALNVVSLGLTLVGLSSCEQPPGTVAPAPRVEASAPVEPDAPVSPQNVVTDPTPDPTPSASPSSIPVTVLTYALSDPRVCWKLRDSDPLTTTIKLTSPSGYYFTFSADDVTVTMNGTTSQVSYEVLHFTGQQSVTAGKCTVTIQAGAIVSFQEGI